MSVISDEKGKRRNSDDSERIIIQSSGRISKKPKWDYDPYSPPKKTGINIAASFKMTGHLCIIYRACHAVSTSYR